MSSQRHEQIDMKGNMYVRTPSDLQSSRIEVFIHSKAWSMYCKLAASRSAKNKCSLLEFVTCIYELRRDIAKSSQNLCPARG
jgi:hypothetical protein